MPTNTCANHKLVLITESGEEMELPEIKEVSLSTNEEENVSIMPSRTCELSFSGTRINTKAWLSLLGFPTANNWLKMHGGVMVKKILEK